MRLIVEILFQGGPRNGEIHALRTPLPLVYEVRTWPYAGIRAHQESINTRGDLLVGIEKYRLVRVMGSRAYVYLHSSTPPCLPHYDPVPSQPTREFFAGVTVSSTNYPIPPSADSSRVDASTEAAQIEIAEWDKILHPVKKPINRRVSR